MYMYIARLNIVLFKYRSIFWINKSVQWNHLSNNMTGPLASNIVSEYQLPKFYLIVVYTHVAINIKSILVFPFR